MICYEFGKTYKKIYGDFFWMEKITDYQIYHTHNYWEFFLCRSGSFDHTINNDTVTYDVNDAIILAPGDYHSLKAKTKNVAHLVIGFTNEYFEKKCREISPDFLRFFKENHLFKVKFSFERLAKIESHMKNLLVSNNKKEQETFISFIIFNILEPMFIHFKNKNQAIPKWFSTLLIECGSSEHLNWKPHDACHFVNYSIAHVNRLFKQILNTTLVDYLIRIKMDNAALLLNDSDMTLKDIASILGYSSISYFSHRFKSYYKMSPHKYKIKCKENIKTERK